MLRSTNLPDKSRKERMENVPLKTVKRMGRLTLQMEAGKRCSALRKLTSPEKDVTVKKVEKMRE